MSRKRKGDIFDITLGDVITCLWLCAAGRCWPSSLSFKLTLFFPPFLLFVSRLVLVAVAALLKKEKVWGEQQPIRKKAHTQHTYTQHTQGERENDRKVKADGLYKESNRRCCLLSPRRRKRSYIYLCTFFLFKSNGFLLFRAPMVGASNGRSLTDFLLFSTHMPSTRTRKRFASFPPSLRQTTMGIPQPRCFMPVARAAA